MAITAPRTLAAVLVAFAFAAGCGGGGPRATAPDTAPSETTTAAPEDGGPDNGTPAAVEAGQPDDRPGGDTPGGSDDECAVLMNPRTVTETARARELMATAEAAPGPASPAQIEEIAAIRWEVRWDRGCPGVWGDEDDARLDALAARTAAREAELEAGARESMKADPAALEADAAAEEEGRRERGPEEPPPEPARSDADGPCQTDEAPWACDEPADEEPPAEEPEPPATTTPVPPSTTAEPEAPESIQDFEDAPAEVPEGQATARRHPDGPVTLGAPVLLASMAEWLCPPEEDWQVGGWTGCGDPYADGDYLSVHSEMRRCYYGPIEMGIGDGYRLDKTITLAEPTADGVAGGRVETAVDVLGFSALELSHPDRRWGHAQARIRQQQTYWYQMADGSEEGPDERPAEYPASGGQRWVQVGGPEHRGVNADGTLAWGLFAIPAPDTC